MERSAPECHATSRNLPPTFRLGTPRVGNHRPTQPVFPLAGTPSRGPFQCAWLAPCNNLQRIPGQGGENGYGRLQGRIENLTKPRTATKRPSCKQPSHGGGQWFESTSAHQPFLTGIHPGGRQPVRPCLRKGVPPAIAAFPEAAAHPGRHTHGWPGRFAASGSGGVAPRSRGPRFREGGRP